MNKFKKLSLVVSAFVMAAFLFASSAMAQPGRATYRGNQGKHKGWTQGKHKGWNKKQTNNNVWWNRNSRVSSRERDRWERMRDRLGVRRDRYYRDGVLTAKERNKLAKRNAKYRRTVRRDRRDWN